MLLSLVFDLSFGAGANAREAHLAAISGFGLSHFGLEKIPGIVTLEHPFADDKQAIEGLNRSTARQVLAAITAARWYTPRSARSHEPMTAGRQKIDRHVTDRTQWKQPSEGFIHLPGGRLHYLDWGGNGRQIHFLHANGFCAGTYTPFLDHLTDTYRVFASDVRGHGDSTFPKSGRIRNWDVFADDLKTIVEGAMDPPVIGMGHSLGAVTTCIAAARFPELFSAVILLDPVFLPVYTRWRHALIRMLGMRGWLPLARGARQRKRSFADKQSALQRFTAGRGIFKSWSEDFIEAYMECGLLEHDADRAILRCDPELEAQIFESVPLSVWQTVARVQCPVLAVGGEQSDTFLPEAGRKLARIAADARVVTIPEAGHFLPMEKPRETAAAIAGFIDRALSAKPAAHGNNRPRSR